MKRLIVVLLAAYAAISLKVNAEGFENRQDKELADIEKRLAERRQELIGKTFYAYFPRRTCHWTSMEIYRTPNEYDKAVYSAESPKRFIVEKTVTGGFGGQAKFYQIRLEDENVGYILESVLRLHYEGNYRAKEKDEDSLKEDCYFKLSPEELQVRLDKFETDRRAAKQAADEKTRREVEERQREAEKAEEELLARRSNAPTILKNMQKADFCVAYGRAIRGETIYDIGDHPDALKLIKTEARRRNILFNDSLIQKEKVRVGVTECQLYAAWGFPQEQNRMVGSWGVHIQHVYGESYIYTENGRVSSWQD